MSGSRFLNWLSFKKKKTPSKRALLRSRLNPLITPRAENDWEAWQTFNPTAIDLDKKIHFLYRAIGQDGISRLGYAFSYDGLMLNGRGKKPVYEHILSSSKQGNFYSSISGGSWGGAEDPRIVRVDNEDRLYMTYTACDGGLRVGLTSIYLDDFLNRNWKWKKPVLISPPGEVHKNWVIFPEKIKGKYAILHSISPRISVAYLNSLESLDGKSNFIRSFYNGKAEWLKKSDWEGWVRGVGPVPLKTEYGWLVFYHAMEKGNFGEYKVGAMVLDKNNPEKIIMRSQYPVLEPSEYYEFDGFKPGVVYASGAVIRGNNLFVYYGASDSYVCVAWTNVRLFFELISKKLRIKMKLFLLKKRKHNNVF